MQGYQIAHGKATRRVYSLGDCLRPVEERDQFPQILFLSPITPDEAQTIITLLQKLLTGSN